MKIVREIDRQMIEIELTEQELYNAYCEQEHQYDMQNCQYYLDSGIYDGEDWFECLSQDDINSLIEEMAYQYRRNVDKYEMHHDYALDDAASRSIKIYQDKYGNAVL